MLISLNWLKEFVDIPKSMAPEELAERLTMHTVEVESVDNTADKFKGVVIGKVLEVKNHPNADKLKVAKVDVKEKILQIVCGAPNLEAGQSVPVARAGTKLFSPKDKQEAIEIKEAEIRGVKSQGMICAEDELGLGEDHAGIMVLEKGAKTGENFVDYWGYKDVIMEVDNKSLTHRPDLWSHYGLAREISAFLNVKLKKYQTKKIIAKNETASIKIKIEDNRLCPRYMAVKIDGLEIKPSPKRVQERLASVGLRPINNIVDITNYVMLETGQPLHAFDSEQVGEIVVRTAKKGETIETLDSEQRNLAEDMLVIADSKKPIAVAGVMGGAGSEISGQTKSVIIESANFNFSSIRKTSTKLGLRTEASQRFEKGLDPHLCAAALEKAVELIMRDCPSALVSGGPEDASDFELNLGPIELDLDWLEKFIGWPINEDKARNILEKLGFETDKKERIFSVNIPTWRASRDVAIKEDLAEEIIRVTGFNNFSPSMPQAEITVPKINQDRKRERIIKTALSGAPAFFEVYNYSFVGEDQLNKLNIDYSQHIRLFNPISSQHTMLRQNLAPNLIGNIKTNQARYEKIKLFEIGSSYTSLEGEFSKDNKSGEKTPYQEKRLGLIMGCQDAGEAYKEIKGAVGFLLDYFYLDGKFKNSEILPNWADKDFAVQIEANGGLIGFINRLDSSYARKNGLKKEIVLAELSLKELFFVLDRSQPKKFQEFEKFPPVIRDLAIVVNDKILYNDIREAMAGFHEYIKSVELFDVYRGEAIGQDKKSLAFRLVYQTEKTMTGEEVDKIQKELVKSLAEKFAAKIRDF